VVAAPGLAGDAAWNTGFEACRGTYVAILAAGHASRPVRLARQLDWLDQRPDVVAVGTASAVRQDIWEPPPEPSTTDRDMIHWSLMAGVEMAWSSLMLRRQAVAAQGQMLKPEFGAAARLNLCHRLCAVGDVTRIDEVLTLCPAEPAIPGPARLEWIRRALLAAYAPILGDGAARAAELVTRHLVSDHKVPGVAVSAELEAVLARLAQAVRPDAADDIVARAVAAGETRTGQTEDELAEAMLGAAEDALRVSVLAVTAGDPALLVASMESLQAQSLHKFEFVVVDRSDAGDAVVPSPWQDDRMRVVRAPGESEDAAWSLGFAECRAPYVAMLAAGKESKPARLARQAAWLDRNPGAVLVGTASAPLHPVPGRPQPAVTHTDGGVVAWLLHAGVEMAWSSLMVRRETAAADGALLRAAYGEAARFELCHRLCREGEVARIDEVLTLCRTTPKMPGPGHIQAMRRVLEDAYAPALGEGATRAAQLIAAHVCGYLPVPDSATLSEIEAVLVSIGQWLKAQGKVEGVSRAMVAVERTQLMCRLQQQSGGRAAAAATRQNGMAPGEAERGGRIGAAIGSFWRGRDRPAAGRGLAT
jgi:hypothetical protein